MKKLALMILLPVVLLCSALADENGFAIPCRKRCGNSCMV